MRTLIIIPIVSLLALIAGGFFVLTQTRNFEVQPTTLIAEVAPPEATTTEKVIHDEQLIKKSEELITQAQELIAKTRQFIEAIKEAQEKSRQVKGIYAGTAASQQYLKDLLDETELNGIVIDVKEYYGINLSSSLKNFVQELHQKDGSTGSPQDVWLIARIVVFRDSSLVEEKPEWHLWATSSPWRDKAGYYWLDPQNEEVQDYIIEFSKRVIDFGFDELQFDYIRYPDDYEGEVEIERYKVIGDFFSKIAKELKDYQPTIILSVDLFGYIATQYNSYDIGQRLIDAEKYFDYLSFMLYPSHFYGGFSWGEIKYPYPEVVEHPYEVVYYSILSAGYPQKTRPWLQDFNLRVDTERGVFYDAEKVRAQIQAAEDSGTSGWLLWNPSYIYTKEALKEVAD